MTTNDNGLTAGNSQPVKTITKHTTNFIAICARLKQAVIGFYFDRGIGLDSIAMLILVAVFAAVRAFK